MVSSGLLGLGGVLATTTVAYGAYRVENIPTEAVDDVLTPRGSGQVGRGGSGPVTGAIGPGGGVGGVGGGSGGDDTVEEDADEVDEGPGEPFNVLLVGDSSRDFVDSESDRASFGDGEGGGSDSIVLVRVDPEAGTAATLPFPRDLWVELADDGGFQRINKAYERGGPRLLIKTITERFDVPVHHYVGLDFEGFRDLVDAVGGVTLSIEHRVRDFNREEERNESGLDIRRTGCVTLDGREALAYVRSRYFQELVDGRWVADDRNDFGRSERQQRFLRQVLAKATSEGLLRPQRIFDLLDAADKSLRVSNDLDAERIVDLARDVRRLRADAFTDYALPVVDDVTPGGARVLVADEVAADPVLDVFRGVDPAAPDVPPTTTPGGPSTPTTTSPAPITPGTASPPTSAPAPIC